MILVAQQPDRCRLKGARRRPIELPDEGLRGTGERLHGRCSEPRTSARKLPGPGSVGLAMGSNGSIDRLCGRQVRISCHGGGGLCHGPLRPSGRRLRQKLLAASSSDRRLFLSTDPAYSNLQGARREGISGQGTGTLALVGETRVTPPATRSLDRLSREAQSGVARPFLKATEPHCGSASVQSGGPSCGHSSGKVPRPSFQGSTRTGQDPPSQPGTPQVTPTPRRRATRRRIGCFVVGSNRTQRP